MVCMAKVCCTVERARLRGCICIFAVSVVCTKQVSWAPVHAGVYITQVCFWRHRTYIWDTITTGCAHALVCSQFVHSRWGTRVRGFNKSMQNTCCLAWGVMFDRRRDGGLFCVFLSCGCMCVYTHTHTLHMGCSMWAQGSRRDTWRARRIQMN